MRPPLGSVEDALKNRGITVSQRKLHLTTEALIKSAALHLTSLPNILVYLLEIPVLIHFSRFVNDKQRPALRMACLFWVWSHVHTTDYGNKSKMSLFQDVISNVGRATRDARK